MEAIECHLEGLLIDSEPIPLPTAIEAHTANPDYAGGIWALVSIDLSKLSGKSKRIHITLPERLLAQMDSYAAQHGQSRSGLIAEAAMTYLVGETH